MRLARGSSTLSLAVATSLLPAAMLPADAGSLNVVWDAPTTNANGTALTDLDGYRLYVGTTAPACPGPTYQAVESATQAPTPGLSVSRRLSGLSTGATYVVRVTAVDLAGNESACSLAASAVAQPDLAVSPTSSVAFGAVTVGATADRTFTVQNASAAALAGGVTADAPFRVVSGGSLSLPAGASQPVVVQFAPTAAGSYAGNVRFTANGDTLSRGVGGSAAAPSVALSVARAGTGAGTVTSAPAGIACGAACSASFPQGTAVTLTAAPAAGSTFAGWAGACSGSGPCTLALGGDVTTAAVFDAVPATPGEIVIDNAPAGVQDPAGGRTFTGGWCATTAGGVYGAGALYSCGPGETYRWTPNLPAAGVWDVYVFVNLGAYRSTAVPVTVTHASGATTIGMNQRTGPGGWQLHGRYAFAAGTAGWVQLSDAGGPAGADAVRFVPVGAPVPAATAVSPGSIVAGSAGPVLTVTGSGFTAASVVRWNGADRPTTFAGATRLTAALTAADVATPGPGAVTVFTPAPGGGTSAALAVTVTAPPAVEFVIDNAPAGVQDAAGGRTFTGGWCATTAGGVYGANALYSCGPGETYRWTPDFPAAGVWDVYVFVNLGSYRSTAVPVTVTHAGGATTVTMNQRSGPGGWRLHGRYAFAAGTAGWVQVSDANGPAGADAVRFVPVP
jgi:hypothetical protein